MGIGLGTGLPRTRSPTCDGHAHKPSQACDEACLHTMVVLPSQLTPWLSHPHHRPPTYLYHAGHLQAAYTHTMDTYTCTTQVTCRLPTHTMDTYTCTTQVTCRLAAHRQQLQLQGASCQGQGSARGLGRRGWRCGLLEWGGWGGWGGCVIPRDRRRRYIPREPA